jgi:von Willebrand factor type A domain
MLSSRQAAIFWLTFVTLSPLLFAQSICTQLTTPMNVRDHRGRLVTGLPPASFRGTFRGKRVTVRSVRVPDTPQRVVLLLDASGSISESGHTWNTARMVAGDFLTNSQSRVATVIFAGKIELSLDFSHTPAEMLQHLQGLQDLGKLLPKEDRKTALLDAVMYALRLLKDPSPGDSIYAVSDGADNYSHSHVEEVQQALLGSGVRFFAFYMTDSTFHPKEPLSGPPLLHALADDSGGAVLDVPDTSGSILYDLSPKGRVQLSGQLAYIYDLMAHFYQLDVTLPAMADRRRRWEWEVVDEHGRTLKDVTLMYPVELVPCEAAITKH